MGLSNEERFSNIVYSISGIIRKSGNLIDNYKYSKIKSLIQELWPAFLGKKSNSSFWILGGGFDLSHFSEESLLRVAFEQNKYHDYDLELEKDDDSGDYNDSRKSRETVDEMLSLTTLVNNSEESAIIEIYQWIENLTYALCRYDDEFSENLWELNKIIRQIQGELFEIIRSNHNYYKVWLLKNIIEKCVCVWDDDIVSKWVRRQNIHHDLRLMEEHSVEELQETYFFLQGKAKREISCETRLFILVALCGRRYHYDHQFKALEKLVNAHNGGIDKIDKETTPKNKSNSENIDLVKLREIFEWCKAQKAEYDQKMRKSYRQFCDLSGQEVK